MKLTKQQQNGLLLILYVSRAGRCNLSQAAEQLGLSLHFLEQIARKLKIAGYLTSFRGPGGGYEIKGNPAVGEVIASLGTWYVNPHRASRVPERRALGQLLASFANAVTPLMKRKVRSLNLELAANETAAMTGIAETTVN